ncbi:MAG TPA: hypothetical protein VH256_02645 [Thermoleophilaceae bacterium]|jgi:hypothetical protein|nr:hypothetical protein [Thermoleophilaceae bacterium]
MPTVEVSRTLVKSPPELWEDLQGERLRETLGAEQVKASEDERLLVWEGDGARGTATLEPSGWGTKVILRAEIEETVTELEPQVARMGLWGRLRGVKPPEPAPWQPESVSAEHFERTFEQLLDDLGSAHRKPFQQD